MMCCRSVLKINRRDVLEGKKFNPNLSPRQACWKLPISVRENSSHRLIRSLILSVFAVSCGHSFSVDSTKFPSGLLIGFCKKSKRI